MFLQISISVVFIILVFMISAQKGNRALISLGGATIVYLLLTLVDNISSKVMIEFLLGTEEDDYANFGSIFQILGIMTIVSITRSSGAFTYFGFKLIQKTKGEPISLFLIIGFFTIFLGIFLDNFLVLLIMIPLTVNITKILDIESWPYLLTEALLVNSAGTVLSFSSVSNILIANYANISVIEFLVHIGFVSLIISVLSLGFLLIILWKKLALPKSGIDLLLSYDVWTLIPKPGLMRKSIIILTCVIIALIMNVDETIPVELITLIGAFILIIISKMNTDEILKSLDFELFVYMLSFFIITGAMNYVGIVEWISYVFKYIGNDDILISLLSLLWASAFLGITVDNVPMIQLFLPVVKNISSPFPVDTQNQFYYALTMGIGWGDSLTPWGDNIIILNLVEQNHGKLPFKTFLKYGFITGIYQLSLASIYFMFIQFSLILGLIIGLVMCIGFIYLLYKRLPRSLKKLDGERKRLRLLRRRAISKSQQSNIDQSSPPGTISAEKAPSDSPTSDSSLSSSDSDSDSEDNLPDDYYNPRSISDE